MGHLHQLKVYISFPPKDYFVELRAHREGSPHRCMFVFFKYQETPHTGSAQLALLYYAQLDSG